MKDLNNKKVVSKVDVVVEEIAGYFLNEFNEANKKYEIPSEIYDQELILIKEKLSQNLNTVLKKYHDQELNLNKEIIIESLKNNAVLKKIVWDRGDLMTKYRHLVYTQNFRAINTQFKKILISQCGAVDIKINRVTGSNISKLLNGILDEIKKGGEEVPANIFASIKTLIKDYSTKYNLAIKVDE